MGVVSNKLRASARGEACTFQIPGVCNCDRSTTVLCHDPSEAKGIGNKGHDYHAAFGCFECHTALDQHQVPDAEFYWRRGMHRTWDRWHARGLIIIPVTIPKQKPSTKIMSRTSLYREATQ